MSDPAHAGSIVAPMYLTGEYYSTHADPDQDAAFKSSALLDLVRSFAISRHWQISSYADVGCGGGGTAALIARGLRSDGHPLSSAIACDIFPNVENLRHPGITCLREDFCQSDHYADLVTAFDVIEHVPDPIGFLRQLALRSSVIALHIPLDSSWVNCFFDRFRSRLTYPGHILLLDPPGAINLLTLSGVLAVDYRYTHGYDAPSGGMTRQQRLFRPIRRALARLSPWLASKTLGGISLMVLGVTPLGMSRLPGIEDPAEIQNPKR